MQIHCGVLVCGIDADEETPVHRLEVYEAIKREEMEVRNEK